MRLLLLFLVWVLFKSQTASTFLRATMIAPIMDAIIIAAIYPLSVRSLESRSESMTYRL